MAEKEGVGGEVPAAQTETRPMLNVAHYLEVLNARNDGTNPATQAQLDFLASLFVRAQVPLNDVRQMIINKINVSVLIDKAKKLPAWEKHSEEFKEKSKAAEALNETDDCAVKAMSLVTGKSYEHCHARLNAFGRNNGQGTFIPHLKAGLEKEGFAITQVEPHEFVKKYPRPHNKLGWVTSRHMKRFHSVWRDGHPYLLFFPGHVAAVTNGVNHDWSAQKTMKVSYIWRVSVASQEKQLETLVDGIAAETVTTERKAAEIDMTAVQAMIDRAIANVTNNQTITTLVLQRKEMANVKLEGLFHKQFPALLKAMNARTVSDRPVNIWLAGPAGSGKTHAAHAGAKNIGLDFYLQGAMSMLHELVGFVDAGGKYHETPFIKAYRDGGVVLLDELDSGDAGALLGLNSALANGGMSLPTGEQITRHKDCIVIGAANTYGLGATSDYIGRNKLDGAFLDRFVKFNWQYDFALERAMCGNPEWADKVNVARQRAKSAGLKVIISPRASVDGAALISAGFTEAEAADMTYLSGLTAEQRKIVEGR